MTQRKGLGPLSTPAPGMRCSPPPHKVPRGCYFSPLIPDPYQVAVSIAVIIIVVVTVVVTIMVLKHAALGLGGLGSHRFLDLLLLGADHFWEGRGTGHRQQGTRLLRSDVPGMGSQGHPHPGTRSRLRLDLGYQGSPEHPNPPCRGGGGRSCLPWLIPSLEHGAGREEGRGGRRWQQGLPTPAPSIWLPAHLGAPGR